MFYGKKFLNENESPRIHYELINSTKFSGSFTEIKEQESGLLIFFLNSNRK